MFKNLILAALLFGSAPADTADQVPAAVATFDASAEPLDRYRQANVALRAWIDQTSASETEPPRITDSRVAQLFQAAFDEAVLPSFPRAGPEAGRLCSLATETLNAYSYHGIAANAGDEERHRISDRNTDKFQDEISRAWAFGIACDAVEIESFERAVAALAATDRTPARMRGVESFRQGTKEVLVATLISQAVPRLRADNRNRLLDAAARNADAFARALTPALRAEVVSEIDGLIRYADVRGAVQLMRVRNAMSRTPCTGLCAF